VLLSSVYPAPDGTAMYQAGSYTTDHRSPMEQRWGGWFVTGDAGNVKHLGNLYLTNIDKPESMVPVAGRFDPDGYLSPDSDIAALMVFDHQMHMMNLLTRLGWEARYGAYEDKGSR